MNVAMRRAVPGLVRQAYGFQRLINRESFWIFRLKTLEPDGLNDVIERTNRALKFWGCRPLCVNAQTIQSSTGNAISDQSPRDPGLFPPMPGEQSALRWSGLKYEEVPIVHIKATYNNTHIQVTRPDNTFITRTSCGTEGFRNSKKSSSVAAQTTGISAATKAVDKGVVHVRVVVKGMGPGRQHAIKGLTMGGLDVISITDNTPIPHNGCRPRKARRL